MRAGPPSRPGRGSAAPAQPSGPQRNTGARQWSRLLGWVLVLGLVLLATGCTVGADDGTVPQNVLAPEGPVAREQDRLWRLVFPIAVGVFVLVQGGLIVLMLRFRSRGEATLPKQVHGNTRLEVIWTMIPALILAFIAVPTTQSIFELSGEPEGALQIRVVGKQFWWEFQYLGSEVVTANELHVPTGRPVFLRMEALHPGIPDTFDVSDPEGATRAPASLDGVIHSFWVPKLAGKQDVVPGHIRTLTIQADEPGIYEGQCAEFCGLAHAEMRLRVIAHDPGDYETWFADQSQPQEFDDLSGEAEQGHALFEDAQCIACHAIRGYETAGGGDALLRVGPDLTHFANRTKFAGGLFDNDDPEQIAAWLADPQAVKPGAQMPDLGLSDDQIDALVAFLMSLE